MLFAFHYLMALQPLSFFLHLPSAPYIGQIRRKSSRKRHKGQIIGLEQCLPNHSAWRTTIHKVSKSWLLLNRQIIIIPNCRSQSSPQCHHLGLCENSHDPKMVKSRIARKKKLPQKSYSYGWCYSNVVLRNSLHALVISPFICWTLSPWDSDEVYPSRWCISENAMYTFPLHARRFSSCGSQRDIWGKGTKG